MLVIRDDVFEGVDLLDEEGDLGAIILEINVLPHASAQLLRFPDIDDLTRCVLPEIDAGKNGNLTELPLDTGELLLLGFRLAIG